MSIIYDGSPEPRPMKATISRTIAAVAENDPKILYLDADLMSCIGMADWAKEHPDRAIACGIAEANMVGIAAGLSSMGWKPIVHSFGVFASRRCFDQVFLSCGYAKNSILIIGTDPGVTAEYNGGTHMPLEDLALMRAIPGSTVVEASDASMFSAVLPQLKDREGVNYIRVGRKMYARIYSEDHPFTVGKGEVLRDGCDLTIVASGIMLEKALSAAAILAERGVSAAVLDLFTVKPLDTELIERYAARTGRMVVAENHNKVGGLFSAISAALAETCPIPLRAVAVEERFGEVGSRDYLTHALGLTTERILEAAEALLLNKRNQ